MLEEVCIVHDNHKLDTYVGDQNNQSGNTIGDRVRIA
jgi:hypothetical protein